MPQHLPSILKHQNIRYNNNFTQGSRALSYSGGLVENDYSQFPKKSEFYAPEVPFCQYSCAAFRM